MSTTDGYFHSFNGENTADNVVISDKDPDGNDVVGIYEYAMQNNTSLTSITLPNTASVIGNNAFENCTALANISSMDNVESIGNCAFRCCRGLTSVIISDSVTSIGTEAFYECSDIATVTIKSNGGNP